MPTKSFPSLLSVLIHFKTHVNKLNTSLTNFKLVSLNKMAMILGWALQHILEALSKNAVQLTFEQHGFELPWVHLYEYFLKINILEKIFQRFFDNLKKTF